MHVCKCLFMYPSHLSPPPPPRPSLLEVFCVVRYPSLLPPMVSADLPISRPRRGGQAAEAASNEASRVLSSGSGLGRHGFVGSESLLRPFGLLASEASGGLVVTGAAAVKRVVFSHDYCSHRFQLIFTTLKPSNNLKSLP